MEQDELALNKAIESGDTDLGKYPMHSPSIIIIIITSWFLISISYSYWYWFILYPAVYLVVLHIKRNLPPIEFFRLIRNKPIALDLLISYCKQQDLKLLKDLYLQFEEIKETANISVLEAYQGKVILPLFAKQIDWVDWVDILDG